MVYIDNKSKNNKSKSNNFRKKGNRNDDSLNLVNTFTKTVMLSGLITQARDDRFFTKNETKRERKNRALNRTKRQEEMVKDYKMGNQDDMLNNFNYGR